MGLDGRSIPSVLQPRTPPPLPTNLRVHALTHACMHAGGGLHSCAMHSPAPCSIHPCLLLPSTPLPLACGRLVSVDPPPKWCRYGLSPTCPHRYGLGPRNPIVRADAMDGAPSFLVRCVWSEANVVEKEREVETMRTVCMRKPSGERWMHGTRNRQEQHSTGAEVLEWTAMMAMRWDVHAAREDVCGSWTWTRDRWVETGRNSDSKWVPIGSTTGKAGGIRTGTRDGPSPVGSS